MADTRTFTFYLGATDDGTKVYPTIELRTKQGSELPAGAEFIDLTKGADGHRKAIGDTTREHLAKLHNITDLGEGPSGLPRQPSMVHNQLPHPIGSSHQHGPAFAVDIHHEKVVGPVVEVSLTARLYHPDGSEGGGAVGGETLTQVVTVAPGITQGNVALLAEVADHWHLSFTGTCAHLPADARARWEVWRNVSPSKAKEQLGDEQYTLVLGLKARYDRLAEELETKTDPQDRVGVVAAMRELQNAAGLRCVTSGYTYGSKWLIRRVPVEVLEQLEQLLVRQPQVDPKQDAGLGAVMAEREITATVTAGAPDNPNMGSDVTGWTVAFRYQGRRLSVPFYMGSGHGDTPPDPVDVLKVVLDDTASFDNNQGDFADWCGEYGYETDSREAKRTFKAVERQAAKLHQFLGDDFDAIAFPGQ